MNRKEVTKYLVPALTLAGIVAAGGSSAWAAPQTPRHPSSINARLHEQHDRIKQGTINHSLTSRERAEVAARDRRIREQEARIRATHNGHLTPVEHARLERELNRNSKDIYRQKHDAQHRHG